MIEAHDACRLLAEMAKARQLKDSADSLGDAVAIRAAEADLESLHSKLNSMMALSSVSRSFPTDGLALQVNNFYNP